MSENEYKPPYKITPKIITLIEQIGEMLGTLSLSFDAENLRLRRIHRIQTIHGSTFQGLFDQAGCFLYVGNKILK